MRDAGTVPVGHGTGSGPVSHAPVRHVPVLLNEVAAAVNAEPGMLVVDGTFGAGGYSSKILDSGAQVIGIDRDPDAIAGGAELVAASSGRLQLRHGRFSQMEEYLGGEMADAVMLDIGVSSMQIDEAGRGFSFLREGPLDMRMAQKGLSAADIVNTFKVSDLTRIFGILGEEKSAGRIARMIEKRRATKPFDTTTDLADAIQGLVGRRHDDKIHPATRVFQALRIFVNDELGELACALIAAERILKPGGRLVVVTFHSLEDRIAKKYFADRIGGSRGSRHMPETAAISASFMQNKKGAIEPSDTEVASNPRARSAKLRFGIRTESAARSDVSFFDLPALPQLQHPVH
jgi:16S rRNA (cytosine1402-N4)-methyltransferase